MMVALVSALATVLLRQLDAVSFYSIDGANVNTIGPDYFHVLSYYAAFSCFDCDHCARTLKLMLKIAAL
jgi:hypothetical protein